MLQEIWGHLCCRYAIRTFMREAAAPGLNPPSQPPRPFTRHLTERYWELADEMASSMRTAAGQRAVGEQHQDRAHHGTDEP